VLIATRAVQGLGAATVYTVSLAILGDEFPPSERGRALGIWTAVAALGLAAGPLVGGAVVESGSWRWIFVLLVPFAFGSLVVTLFAARESRDETASRSLDVAGIVASVAALVALATLLIQTATWGLVSLESALLAVIVLAAGTVFVVVERRAAAPLLDVVLVALAVVGVGIGLAFAPMTKAVLDAVPAAKAGMASGALLMTRMIGATFGPAACGAVFRGLEEAANGDAAGTFATGLTGAMGLAAGLAAVGAALVFLLGRGAPGDAVAAAATP
jgi:MFS family permease